MRFLTAGVVVGLFMAFTSMFSPDLHAQTNTITSTYGWTATITIAPKKVVVSTTNCEWYYHYGIDYTVSVVFSGSTSNRGLNFNTYLACSGGSGNEPYSSSHYYTSNQTEARTTGPNHRQYNSVSAYNYGSNPSCTNITLANANCTAVRLEYWGNGVANGSTTFPIAPMPGPLPVELVDFSAEANNQQVDLNWITATERNNDYFTIEKTTDGINYELVGEVKGAGNSATTKRYAFTDYSPSRGISYYRLTQTDFNGQREVFEPKSIDLIQNTAITNVYPNPAVDSKVNVVIAESGNTVINVYNLYGQLVKTQAIDAHQANTTEQIELPEGGNTFFVELIQNDILVGRHKILTAR